MTYTEICEGLRRAGIEEYRNEALLLISRFCGVGEASALCNPEADYASEELSAAFCRRVAREPLQYIFGEWDFCGEVYRVMPGVLIPRPETELLVLRACELLPQNSVFLDLCCGSGCIGISVLKRRPDCRCVAVDKYDIPVRITAENAEKNRVAKRHTTVKLDVLSEKDITEFIKTTDFSAVLSNPPYIAESEIGGLAPELASEPREALDGGEDGLVFYRSIVKGFRETVVNGGFMLFEIGYNQADDIKRIADEAGFVCRTEKDLSGNDRLAEIKSI